MPEESSNKLAKREPTRVWRIGAVADQPDVTLANRSSLVTMLMALAGSWATLGPEFLLTGIAKGCLLVAFACLAWAGHKISTEQGARSEFIPPWARQLQASLADLKRRQLEGASVPVTPLGVTFEPGAVPYETYQPETQGGRAVTGHYFRVGLTNPAKMNVKAQVLLLECDPCPPGLVTGHPLSEMGSGAREIDVPGLTPTKPMKFANVVFEHHWMENADRRAWGIAFADDQVPRALPIGDYTLTLAIIGPTTTAFRTAYVVANPLTKALVFSVGNPPVLPQEVRTAIRELQDAARGQTSPDQKSEDEG